ncbi:MAG: hypothetical protein COW01_07455 [Bdellovibrionales bacterium CG12_big_fil_rev_8_21_14_0_65_38_15]|nr:MAG: hypothetical protein COW01_07455 [Bdellovibrionales bacterium CG12_big_fil_rev_8_21_14_0_65_38_15]PIR29748.1 MAG: hypothetical protein COV38_09095 [Bdellovibrionales bacterium CG11_big_fil_rev_8_21_14_0_20_38_13]
MLTIITNIICLLLIVTTASASEEDELQQKLKKKMIENEIQIKKMIKKGELETRKSGVII